MALVEATNPFELSVKLGATNDKTITKRYVLQATTAAEAVTVAGDILTQLALVSAGKVVGYSINHVYIEDNYTRPTSEDAEYGEEATITGKILDEPFKTYTLRIPYPLIGLFIASAGRNRDIIDISDAAVLGYAGLFNSGAAAYVSDGEFTETVEAGRRV